MKIQILFFSLVLFFLSTFGQKQICVDGSASDSGDGTLQKNKGKFGSIGKSDGKNFFHAFRNVRRRNCIREL